MTLNQLKNEKTSLEEKMDQLRRDKLKVTLKENYSLLLDYKNNLENTTDRDFKRLLENFMQDIIKIESDHRL